MDGHIQGAARRITQRIGNGNSDRVDAVVRVSVAAVERAKRGRLGHARRVDRGRASAGRGAVAPVDRVRVWFVGQRRGLIVDLDVARVVGELADVGNRKKRAFVGRLIVGDGERQRVFALLVDQRRHLRIGRGFGRHADRRLDRAVGLGRLILVGRGGGHRIFERLLHRQRFNLGRALRGGRFAGIKAERFAFAQAGQHDRRDHQRARTDREHASLFQLAHHQRTVKVVTRAVERRHTPIAAQRFPDCGKLPRSSHHSMFLRRTLGARVGAHVRGSQTWPPPLARQALLSLAARRSVKL